MKEEALKLADSYEIRANFIVSHHEKSGRVRMSTTNQAMVKRCKNTADMIRKLVAELDKQGEPVAWISKHSLKDIEQTWELTSLSPTKDDYFDVPLYTAPQTKPEGYGKAVPLSDEEIEHFIEQIIWSLGLSTDWNGQENWDAAIKFFRRAIQERLGIK